MYAAGKIPGGFFKREGRATERATLTARMIDRPIRPLWPKGFRNEVQVICTVLSADLSRRTTSSASTEHRRRWRSRRSVPRAGRRRSHRPDRRRVRRQPDAAAAGGVDARPHRRRHAGRADDGRGRRGRDPRGRDPRRARARPRRDPPICDAIDDLRAQVGKPKWIDLELVDELDAQHGVDHRCGDRRARSSRGQTVVDELVGASSARHHDGVHRRRHRARAAGSERPREHPREEAARGCRGPGTRAVRVRAARADRRGAGLEGAQVARSATSSTSRILEESRCRSRSARRPQRASPSSRTRSRSST